VVKVNNHHPEYRFLLLPAARHDYLSRHHCFLVVNDRRRMKWVASSRDRLFASVQKYCPELAWPSRNTEPMATTGSLSEFKVTSWSSLEILLWTLNTISSYSQGSTVTSVLFQNRHSARVFISPCLIRDRSSVPMYEHAPTRRGLPLATSQLEEYCNKVSGFCCIVTVNRRTITGNLSAFVAGQTFLPFDRYLLPLLPRIRRRRRLLEPR